MFRPTCDNSVTTSPPARPPPANLRISKCLPAQPMCTKPDRSNRAVPHPRAPAAHRNPSRHPLPSASLPPAATGRVLALRQFATLELAARNISARPAARAPHQSPPPPRHAEGHDLPRPHRTPTNHAYARPTTATNTESSSPPRAALCRARQT